MMNFIKHGMANQQNRLLLFMKLKKKISIMNSTIT